MRFSALVYGILTFGALTAPLAARAQDTFAAEMDLFELHLGKGPEHLVLDSTFTMGAGADQFVVMVEGGSDARPAFDNWAAQPLYRRALSDAVGISAGWRHEFRAGPDLDHAAFGIDAALAPWLSSEHFLYLSQRGDVTGSTELVGSWSLAPRLTLEPRVTVGWSAQRVPQESLGSGLTDIEMSARLRRAMGENANVYLGVIHERLLGDTRAIAITSGSPGHVTRGVIGLGFNF